MFEPFIIRALIAAVLTALAAGPIGCVMIWRRTAYFSDSLAHASLSGVVLGALLGVTPNATVAAVVCLFAFLMMKIPARTIIGMDLYLLIIGQTALCGALVCLSYMPSFRGNLTSYLFGDVLSVGTEDILFISAASGIALLLLLKNWKKQVFCAVAPDIAQSENISVRKQERLFTLVLALFVAAAFKTTGLLLVSALLIIPAAAARPISKTPEQAARTAAFAGALCSVSGIAASVAFDMPAAPAIELFCAFLFGLSLLKYFFNKRKR